LNIFHQARSLNDLGSDFSAASLGLPEVVSSFFGFTASLSVEDLFYYSTVSIEI